MTSCTSSSSAVKKHSRQSCAPLTVRIRPSPRTSFCELTQSFLSLQSLIYLIAVSRSSQHCPSFVANTAKFRRHVLQVYQKADHVLNRPHANAWEAFSVCLEHVMPNNIMIYLHPIQQFFQKPVLRNPPNTEFHQTVLHIKLNLSIRKH